MTAAAARRLGLECVVVVSGDRPATPTGNVLLDEMFGPTVIWLGQTGPDQFGDRQLRNRFGLLRHRARHRRHVRGLVAEGRRPYGMPIGGASTVGALGYVGAALELTGQAEAMGGRSRPGRRGRRLRRHPRRAGSGPRRPRPHPRRRRRCPARPRHPRSRRRQVTWPRWPASRSRRDPPPSTTNGSAATMATSPNRAGRRSCSPPAPRASCSTPSTPARRWPGLSRPGGRAGSTPAPAPSFCIPAGPPGLFAADLGTWVRGGPAVPPTPAAISRSH